MWLFLILNLGGSYLRRIELATLTLLLISFFIFTLGSVLYIRKLMAEYELPWELQLAAFGFIFIIVILIISKMLSKVEFDG